MTIPDDQDPILPDFNDLTPPSEEANPSPFDSSPFDAPAFDNSSFDHPTYDNPTFDSDPFADIPLPELPESETPSETTGTPLNLEDIIQADQEGREAPPIPEDTWERPAPVEHDLHYKSWMLFVGIILLFIAFFQPIKVSLHKIFFKPPVSSVERVANEFIAIAYNGVEDAPIPGSPNVSTDMFIEQMRLLEEGGYHPITLQDVADFYHKGKLLPHRAVLITFEQTKRNTYNAVRELLQEKKWPAVMGVNTLAVRGMNQETLIWHYLNEMKQLGFWELAAESNLGFTHIETAPFDSPATFFTSPMWIKDENRYETRSEFEKRIEGDHTSVIEDFERETESRPLAFFFPLGNYGQYDERAQMVRSINLTQVEKHYQLGFTIGMLALNTQSSDPRRLNRLLINPSWSPNAFISMIDSFWSKTWSESADSTTLYSASSWLGDWGDVITRNESVVLKAIQPLELFDGNSTTGTAGAKAWLIGSDTFKDGTASFIFNMRHGRFGVYLRSTNRGEYVFVGIDDRGNVTARQKLQDVDELILGTDTLTTDVTVSHNLVVTLRDNLLFVHIDGKMMFNGRILLRGKSEPGLIGASVWDNLAGVASTEIISTRITGRHDAIVTWAPSTGHQIGHLNSWLGANAHRFAILSPPWIEIAAAGPASMMEWDTPSVKLISNSNAAKLMPRIRVVNLDSLTKIQEQEIASRLVRYQVQGVYIDASQCDPEKLPQLVAWLSRLNDLLMRDQLKLALRLPPGFEKRSSSINIAQILPGVTLVGDHLEEFGLPPENTMPVVTVPDSEANATVQYYYQVANVLSEGAVVSQEAKNEEMRRKGFEAFAMADYEEAISCWQKWADHDPDNPEPLSLLGDAYLRNLDKTNAALYYAKSLEVNPGQINLAVRYSQLLLDMKENENSNSLLDTYARTFPNHPQITIAQARRLADAQHIEEARTIMERLVSNDPQNIEARLVLQNYLKDPQSRYANMHQLLSMGTASKTHLYGFAQDIISSELLTIPESTIFFPFIRENAEDGPNLRTQKIYDSLLPITNSVSENFALSPLSDAWIPWNGVYTPAKGKYELNASVAVSEAFLRLKKSELIRDASIAVSIDESVGAFWLYARRSGRAMLRFGYDNDGFIRMQAWHDGRLRSSESKPWLRPPGKITLSFELRGDGAMGFQNGRPLFDTRIHIPKEVCYGWWCVAPFSPDMGSAKASILDINVDPLPAGIALIPILENQQISTVQEQLRLQIRDISAIAPVTFVQHPNGTIPTTPDINLAPYKLFCAFHRLRLLPVAELPYYSVVKPKLLADLIRNHRLEGLIIRVTSMPPPSWFKEMATEIESTDGNIIVIQSTPPLWPPQLDPLEVIQPETEFVRLRGIPDVQVVEIQRGNIILPPVQDVWQVPAVPLQEWSRMDPKERRKNLAPHIIVTPRTGLVPNESFAKTRAAGDVAFKKRPKNLDIVSFKGSKNYQNIPKTLGATWSESSFHANNSELIVVESDTADSIPTQTSLTNAVESISGTIPTEVAPIEPVAPILDSAVNLTDDTTDGIQKELPMNLRTELSKELSKDLSKEIPTEIKPTVSAVTNRLEDAVDPQAHADPDDRLDNLKPELESVSEVLEEAEAKLETTTETTPKVKPETTPVAKPKTTPTTPTSSEASVPSNKPVLQPATDAAKAASETLPEPATPPLWQQI